MGDDYKLFYFSGLKYDLYGLQEVNNLARFISVIKIKGVDWRSGHPFVLADRWDCMEDG